MGIDDVDYGLFCLWNDVDDPEFLGRIVQGEFDVLVPSIGSWNEDNTLNIISTSEINEFISKVKNVNSNIKIIAWFSTYPKDVLPNLSTPELRQKCVDEVEGLVNYANWDGILDDTERWIGTKDDQFQYFTECAKTIESKGVLYYPWMWYSSLAYVNSQRVAIGAYASHTLYETEWKNALDRCQETTDVAFSWYMMCDHYSDTPTLKQQLEFLDEKIAEKGANYYSKMDILGLYYYSSMQEEDWDAWVSWITKNPVSTPCPTQSPTSTPVPTPSPTSTPVPTPSPTSTPVPTPSPTTESLPTPTPSPSQTPTLTPTPTNTPSPIPTMNATILIPTPSPIFEPDSTTAINFSFFHLLSEAALREYEHYGFHIRYIRL